MRRTVLILLLSTAARIAPDDSPGSTPRPVPPLFATSDHCIACHNGLTTTHGHDVSIGTEWRPGMMANAARDPYWQAAVRREVLDHPTAQGAIEHECAACHMPMTRFEAKAAGAHAGVFENLAAGEGPRAALALDGVSCSICHQIRAEKLGEPESFTAGFVVDTALATGQRSIYGPFEIDAGRSRVMNSASGFRPSEAKHLGSSEMCATCHTLFTHALGKDGEAVGRLPEQVPYLEWRHSMYRDTQSCQSCHMPALSEKTAITSVLGQPRDGFSRLGFLGGNFFMIRMLNRYRSEQGVTALPAELERAASGDVEHLQSSSARLTLEPRLSGDWLETAVGVENLAGHKLPTAYPSRRTWLHFTVKDSAGKLLFESGAITPEGRIVGNDNDGDASKYEPHYQVIEHSEQVQIYEPILAGPDGSVTTGLLTASRYLKDNRLLPKGFKKHSAQAEVAVHGEATDDNDFQGGSDQIVYRVKLAGTNGPVTVSAELWYQSIGYRWAENLGKQESAESNRFNSYYKSMADSSAIRLASATAEVPVGSSAREKAVRGLRASGGSDRSVGSVGFQEEESNGR